MRSNVKVLRGNNSTDEILTRLKNCNVMEVGGWRLNSF